MVGLLGTDQRVARFERTQLIHAFGTERVLVFGSGQLLRSVLYRFVPARWGKPIPASYSDVDRKRASVWQNERRNRLIAGLAKAAAEGNGVEFNRRLDRSGKVPSFDRPVGVAVVVENEEHAAVLGRVLPN